jgi:hypothetical protein
MPSIVSPSGWSVKVGGGQTHLYSTYPETCHSERNAVERRIPLNYTMRDSSLLHLPHRRCGSVAQNDMPQSDFESPIKVGGICPSGKCRSCVLDASGG